jgi:ADP-heptose:LPS heptosyltransferase|tara:strand:- start:251 stop:1102 length:852 start_codon:yes stop_codon:yes gene_type:complete
VRPNLYHVSGGVGKHLQFTALFEPLVKKHKQKLIINSGYPELFSYCLQVADSKPLVNEIFYDTYFKYFSNFNNLFFHDPYQSDWLKGESNIVKKWAELYDVEVEDLRPNFDINKEREKVLLPHIQVMDKFVLLQFTGGQGVIINNNYDNSNHGRNYKYGQELINVLKENFPHHLFIVFGHPNEQQQYTGETIFNDETGAPLFSKREDFMILSKYCDFFVCIDSALQHMVSNQSFNKKGVVLWGSTSYKRFGYDTNINITSKYPYCVEIDPRLIINEVKKFKDE